MTNIEPDITLNGIYPIGKAAELLGIDRSTLRYYTNSGIIRCRLSLSGRKRYEGRELLNLWRKKM